MNPVVDILFLIFGLFFAFIWVVPGIFLIVFGYAARKQHKSIKNLAVIVIGASSILAFVGWQWIHPRIVTAHDINIVKGNIYKVTAPSYKLVNLDVDANLSYEGGMRIETLYGTGKGPKYDIEVDQSNGVQQASDLKYNGGAAGDAIYNGCATSSAVYTCNDIGSYLGQPVYFESSPAQGQLPSSIYYKLNGMLLIIEDNPLNYPNAPNLSSSQALNIIQSLEPMSSTDIRTALIVHYNDDMLTFNQPGNSLLPAGD